MLDASWKHDWRNLEAFGGLQMLSTSVWRSSSAQFRRNQVQKWIFLNLSSGLKRIGAAYARTAWGRQHWIWRGIWGLGCRNSCDILLVRREPYWKKWKGHVARFLHARRQINVRVISFHPVPIFENLKRPTCSMACYCHIWLLPRKHFIRPFMI